MKAFGANADIYARLNGDLANDIEYIWDGPRPLWPFETLEDVIFDPALSWLGSSSTGESAKDAFRACICYLSLDAEHSRTIEAYGSFLEDLGKSMLDVAVNVSFRKRARATSRNSTPAKPSIGNTMTEDGDYVDSESEDEFDRKWHRLDSFL
ncbi:uncharacterized protein EKO05_0008952 [Ascochyta rabiei]|uniref:uncharacterized protein n=1 Tax=Didymella rabiei TaxID=5454 RepID=UPI0022013C1A|nr:uncharacterized protein EKO05_0008952 [Ascochyta rabiei]UPX18660.1 hypothetical protein EKO05_0008952 [Ascochyta rabiei]